ncbi:RraA family protein [Burkholderia cenocepacia]|uniref:hypothetical protein n=1 Tax=Burkholderia cenocepacia TaxID=95486 RepID=UPI00299E4C25|nr:hypothetical protein [Burkholderia cenocepacia]
MQVSIGDVVINPDDVITGDVDGVVVMWPGEVDEVVRKCRAGEEKVVEFRARIREGATTVQLLGLEKSCSVRIADKVEKGGDDEKTYGAAR